MHVVERMLDLAEIKKGEFLIDLGSGDGRIPVTAAKKYGARGLGVDLDPDRIKEANENVKKNDVGNMVEIRRQNLFETDISKADVISMYLLTDLNLRLRPKLLDLKPGTRLVSHAFSMGDWLPEQKETLAPRYDVYLWIVPAKVEGRWTVQRGEKQFTVEFKQKYQNFEGTAQVDGKSVPVTNGRLRGKDDHLRRPGRQPARHVPRRGRRRRHQGRRRLAGKRGWLARRRLQSPTQSSEHSHVDAGHQRRRAPASRSSMASR